MRRAVTVGAAVGRVLLLLCGTVALALTMPAGAPAAVQPDNSGTEFWFAIYGYNGSAQKTLFIAADEATSGTVEVPRLSFAQPFTVAGGTITPVTLPAATELVAAGVGPSVHVSAGKEVTVSGLVYLPAASDAFLALPADGAGTRYTVMAWATGTDTAFSQFAVAAAHDDTTVTITPTSATVDGHLAGVAYTVTLDAGDAYLAREGPLVMGDLTGSVVSSDKPVAVSGGNSCGWVPNTGTGACNALIEQQPPDDAWGRAVLTAPLKTRLGGDTFRILASQDDTDVAIDGTAVATLDAGEFHTQLVAGPSVVSASKPVLVAQFANGSTFDMVSNADPSMMLIAPFEQFLASYLVPTPSGFATNVLNLVAPAGAVGAIAIDGAAVPSSAFVPIGTSGFSAAQVDVTPGAHAVTGPGARFGVFGYGFDLADAYSLPGGMSLAAVARIATIVLTADDETPTVGDEACVTALVSDAGGAPIPGAAVDFTVAGANEASGSVTTDASGRATFCYRGARLGTDPIRGAVGPLAGHTALTWIAPASPPPAAGPPPPPPPVPPPPPPAIASIGPPRATPAAPRGSLRLTKTADKRSVRAGRRVTFRLTLRNPSRGDVRNVRVCDRLPAGLAYVFSNPDARLDRGRRCWSLGTLRAGRTRVLRITTRALRGARGRRTNTATATGTGAAARAAVAPVNVLGVAAAGGGVTG